jgi:hypothetical protein
MTMEEFENLANIIYAPNKFTDFICCMCVASIMLEVCVGLCVCERECVCVHVSVCVRARAMREKRRATYCEDFECL